TAIRFSRRGHARRSNRALAARHPRRVPTCAGCVIDCTVRFTLRTASGCVGPIACAVPLVIFDGGWCEAVMGIKKLDTIWIDGQLVPWDAATDHLLAHSMHYGVGAFEGIRCYQRADGRSAIFRLREHIDRLLDTCTICTLECPYTRDQIMHACLE